MESIAQNHPDIETQTPSKIDDVRQEPEKHEKVLVNKEEKQVKLNIEEPKNKRVRFADELERDLNLSLKVEGYGTHHEREAQDQQELSLKANATINLPIVLGLGCSKHELIQHEIFPEEVRKVKDNSCAEGTSVGNYHEREVQIHDFDLNLQAEEYQTGRDNPTHEREEDQELNLKLKL